MRELLTLKALAVIVVVLLLLAGVVDDVVWPNGVAVYIGKKDQESKKIYQEKSCELVLLAICIRLD